ncbi:zinc finger protein 16 [Trichonephila clavipes]|nr:zinc finger protein 16 [Trichonephila clavipes]
MDHKVFSNEYETPTENDLERTFATLQPFSSTSAIAFENVQNEYRPIAYEEFLNYSPQSPAINCSLPMEDCRREPQVSNANELLSCLQGQNNFQKVQPNLVSEYIESIGVNKEVQGSVQEDSVSISTVGECIRTACDSLLGINSQHNDLHSRNFDSRSEGYIQSEIPLFDPKAEVSVHLDANVCKNSENKSESIQFRKYFKSDSGSNFYDSSVNSDPFTEKIIIFLKQRNSVLRKFTAKMLKNI